MKKNIDVTNLSLILSEFIDNTNQSFKDLDAIIDRYMSGIGTCIEKLNDGYDALVADLNSNFRIIKTDLLNVSDQLKAYKCLLEEHEHRLRYIENYLRENNYGDPFIPINSGEN